MSCDDFRFVFLLFWFSYLHFVVFRLFYTMHVSIVSCGDGSLMRRCIDELTFLH